MKSEFKLLIPGANTHAGTIKVTNPSTLQPLGSVQSADADALECALANADRVFKDRSQHIPAWERIKILKKVALRMEALADEFALGAAQEGGKPLKDSEVEVARAIDGIHSCVEFLRTQAGEEIPMGVTPSSAHRLAVTSHEPVGPVLAFSAFNHPVNLIIHQVMPAVATGCPVIVKPAATTPLSCFRIVELLHEAGLPPAWCQALAVDDHDLSNRAVADERIAFFSFIGSAAVGWNLKSKLAPGTHCALEHGGVAPVVVAADADLDKALPLLTRAGFYHAGQVCVSVQRIYVHHSRLNELAERLTAAAQKLVVGDAAAPETDVGPIISGKELKRIHDWVETAVAGGAELRCGGNPHPDHPDVCYQPTVLVNPPDSADVSQQEVFGPVVCLYGVESIDEAIARANAVPFSFQAAVFAQSIDTIMKCYRELNAAAVMANDHTAFRVDWMPFAGRKHSGYGIGGIPHTMADMQFKKLLVIHTP
jgi:acyl-CoA reductase-like NAD-dependent aldehyde dehydrogenase